MECWWFFKRHFFSPDIISRCCMLYCDVLSSLPSSSAINPINLLFPPLFFPFRSSLAPPALPSVSRSIELFLPALSVALVSFSFHSSLSSMFASKHDYHVDMHQVLRPERNKTYHQDRTNVHPCVASNLRPRSPKIPTTVLKNLV